MSSHLADYPTEEAQALAVAVLPAIHHPLAAAVLRRAWLKVVTFLRLDARKLVALHANSLNNTYITGFTPTQVSGAPLLATLCYCCVR